MPAGDSFLFLSFAYFGTNKMLSEAIWPKHFVQNLSKLPNFAKICCKKVYYYYSQMAASSLVLIFLHFLSSFGGICSVFVSHGVRQRNSSVPLREVVGTSRATALIAPFQQQTMAGRQAVRAGHEDCPYCEPKKCSGGPRAAGGRVGLCLTIRDGDGLLVSNRCVGSRKELNRAMFVRQLPPTARNRRQGCERTAGTAAAALAEEEGTEAMVEELCWCEAAQHRKSLLEEGLANSQRASSIQHSRRRKNHRGMAPSYRKPHSTDNSTTVPEQQQQQQLPYHRPPYSSAVEYSSDRAQSDAAVASGSANGPPQFIIQNSIVICAAFISRFLPSANYYRFFNAICVYLNNKF